MAIEVMTLPPQLIQVSARWGTVELVAAGSRGARMTDLRIACSLLETKRQERRTQVPDRVSARVQEVRPLTDGYALRFPADDAALTELMHLIQLERQCCGFLAFRLTVEPGGGPVWLELTGPEGTKSFLESAFSLDSATQH
jgi:hypothetical protein